MKRLLSLGMVLGLLFTTHAVHAEPYLAVRTGLKCMACHVNPAGGGKRNTYGQIYGQSVLPSQATTAPLGELMSRYVDIGGDLRTSANVSMAPGDEEDQYEFATERATFYIEGRLVPNRLTMYLDQRLAPGVSNREAWLLYQTESQEWFLKAGSFYLPYGLRLEDDSAFIREATGVSFNNADNGLMVGHDLGHWSSRLSLTNGANGGGETNKDKQASLRIAHIRSGWRAGVSGNVNAGDEATSRTMYNIFGGLRLWKIDWLAELDWVNDRDGDETTSQEILFLEANKEVFKGNNVKITYEYLDPDTHVSEDHRTRTSLIWEHTPIPMLQVRMGARIADGIPQNTAQNTDTVFAQLHVWF